VIRESGLTPLAVGFHASPAETLSRTSTAHCVLVLRYFRGPKPLGYHMGVTDAAGANDHISAREFREAEGTRGWPVLGDGATTFFPTDTFAKAAQLVQAIAAMNGIDKHRPDIDLRADG
jgi:hypothetical protein